MYRAFIVSLAIFASGAFVDDVTHPQSAPAQSAASPAPGTSIAITCDQAVGPRSNMMMFPGPMPTASAGPTVTETCVNAASDTSGITVQLTITQGTQHYPLNTVETLTLQ